MSYSVTRAIISDLGNVILWFDNSIFYRKIAQYGPLSVPEVREIVHRSPEFVELFDLGKLSPAEFYRRAISKLGVRVGYDEFMAAYADVFRLNRPVLELMKKLKPKYRLVLVSNVDPVRYGHIQKTFPEIMIFDGYVLSFELGVMKPDPRVYREALRLAQSDPASCVFIDDLEENVRGAESLGVRGILYRRGMDLEREIIRLG